MFNRVLVAVIGSSSSGKTTAVEVLIKGLTKLGYNVASAKHIPEIDFTIDTRGKDTWRHSNAGASTVLSVAQNEIATIRKVKTNEYTFQQLISEIPDEVDVIIVEGFKTFVEQDRTIPTIVAIRTKKEVLEAQKRYKKIVAYIGYIADSKIETEIPIIDALKEPEKLVKLVSAKIAVMVERKRKRDEKIAIKVGENILPLGGFVQNIVRNTVLSMVSSLKGAKIRGNEKVSIVVKQKAKD